MHDFSLGPPVDVGEYCGPLLDGKPIHKGNCEDGVYGCRSCNSAARHLTDEQLVELGWPTTGTCDACNAVVPVKDICGDFDHEDRTYREVCRSCKDKISAAVLKEIATDRDRYYDDSDYDW